MISYKYMISYECTKTPRNQQYEYIYKRKIKSIPKPQGIK